MPENNDMLACYIFLFDNKIDRNSMNYILGLVNYLKNYSFIPFTNNAEQFQTKTQIFENHFMRNHDMNHKNTNEARSINYTIIMQASLFTRFQRK